MGSAASGLTPLETKESGGGPSLWWPQRKIAWCLQGLTLPRTFPNAFDSAAPSGWARMWKPSPQAEADPSHTSRPQLSLSEGSAAGPCGSESFFSVRLARPRGKDCFSPLLFRRPVAVLPPREAGSGGPWRGGAWLTRGATQQACSTRPDAVASALPGSVRHLCLLVAALETGVIQGIPRMLMPSPSW